MSIERAEKLKELLTDKFVVVDAGTPELKRFQNWTGKVRTVNMNCRALVEFDGPVDIGWYDIDPDFLKVVDAPVKKAATHEAKAAPAAAKPAAAKPAATAGKSPLDAIRAQQAAKAGGAAPAAAAPAGAKPSPLDMIRKQQAAKAAAPAPEATAVAPAPAAETEPSPAPAAAAPAAPKPLPTTGPDGKPLSKLDLIRMQGAKK